MAAGSDPKQSAPSLLERWRALAPAAPPPAPRRSRPPPPLAPPAAAPQEPVTTGETLIPQAQPVPGADPGALLRKIEVAIAAEEAIAAALPSPERVALAKAARDALRPLRDALAADPATRDPAELVSAFEQAEEILEALFLVPEPSAASEG